MEANISNEFASVTVAVDEAANGPRVCITDARSGRRRYFDPLELESLVWAADGALAALVDPASGRWADGPPGPSSLGLVALDGGQRAAGARA